MRILIALLFAVFAGTVSAQDRGVYIGAGAGWTDLETDGFNVVLPSEPPQIIPTKVDDSDSGWRGYVGYRFSPYFGIELDYTDLGNFVEEDMDNNLQTKWDAKSTDLTVVGFLPLADGRVDLFARLGASFWDVDASTSEIATPFLDPDFGVEPDGSGTNFVWSVGINFNLLSSKRLHLRGEYTVYDAISDTDKLRYGGVSIGYTF